jgi:hypothetical protein
MPKKNLLTLFFILLLSCFLTNCTLLSDNESDTTQNQALNEHLEILKHFKNVYTTERAQQ